EDRLDDLLDERDSDSADALLKEIIQEVRQFAEGTAQSDDITCMVIQRK
ncbi:MAG: SpoIIE family protein phosphatase, partial [Phaeodactylibacter sp.]|nr:SpoIIE family protein phosphatase [Phaeodactylibacter sp.]